MPLLSHQNPLLTSSLVKNFIRCLASATQNIDTKHYDIIVAGGGMVGTTLACTLSKNEILKNHRILLLEGSPKKEWQLPENYTNRVSSLNPGTRRLLNSIGAWKDIEKYRFNPIKHMQVWDALSDSVIRFNQDDIGESVAYVVENDVLLAAVQKQVEMQHNIEVMYQSKITKCDLDGDKNPSVHLNNGKSYSCDLVLGCDGAKSQVRQSMSTNYISWEYDNMGVVATVQIDDVTDDNCTAWQRFLPNSEVVALLPLGKGLSSLVWSTSNSKAKHLLALSDEDFVSRLNEALLTDFPKSTITNQATKLMDDLTNFWTCSTSSSSQKIPPKIAQCQGQSRAAFPLGFGHATNYVAQGVALVGDAAHRVHPLAGQGVNLGFGDVQCLNDILSDAVYCGNKIGGLDVLRQYETQQQRNNIPTMLTTEGLFRLYGSEFVPIIVMRSLGLQAINALTPLKKLIMSRASG